MGVDEGPDVGLELGGGAVDAAPDLLVGEQGEEALDLVLIQEAPVGVKWTCQRGRLASQSRIGLVLWVA